MRGENFDFRTTFEHNASDWAVRCYTIRIFLAQTIKMSACRPLLGSGNR